MKVTRTYRHNKLAYYSDDNSDEFWPNHWANLDWRAWLESGKAGILSPYERPFLKYLPKEGKILEAGCGLGQIVAALQVRGYDIEGVEFSSETVSMVKEYMPEIPVQQGDISNLNYPDDHFAAYISLGVMEHFEGGPDVVLKEARRVLKPDGLLLVSVPRIHLLRRLKIILGCFSEVSDKEFYQYAFPIGLFRKLLQQQGFIFKATYFYGAFKGCKDEIALLSSLYQRGKVSQEMVNLMDQSRILNLATSHMMLFVATKAVASG